MTETLDLIITFKELLYRGLNEKREDIHSQITKYMKDIIQETLRNKFPKLKQIPWHFEKIRWSQATEKYFITIGPNWPKEKG